VDSSKMWDRVLKHVESRLGKEVAETWFQPSRLGSVKGSVARVVVPNKFFGEWLERNYRDVIAEALRTNDAVGEGEVKVVFIVEEKEEIGGRLAPVGPPMGEQGPIGTRGRRQIPNSRYTFGNFVVGASNQFAHAASRAVAEAPARAYNPFFLYGGGWGWGRRTF